MDQFDACKMQLTNANIEVKELKGRAAEQEDRLTETDNNNLEL